MTPSSHHGQSKHVNVHDTRVLPVDKGRDVYSIAVRCFNCGWSGTFLIPKGDRAPAHGISERPGYCPSCNVRDVGKVRP